jgi:hypothetical protein
MSPEEKRLIEIGAKMRGLSASALLVSSAIKEARNIMREEAQNEQSMNDAREDRFQPLKTRDEKLKFIADVWGISVEDLKEREIRFETGDERKKAVFDDFYKWSKAFTAAIEKQHGPVPKNEKELEAYLAKIEQAR